MPTPLPDSRVTPRFAGIATFCRFPTIAAAPGPLDWALYGVAFDSGVTYRPGARFGPRAIREASQYVKPYHLEHRVNVAEKLSIADAGDAPVAPFDLEANLEGVAGFAAGLPAAKLLAVGGDHSIALANIRACWERAGKPAGGVACLHFDAHLDTVDRVWGEGLSHASVFRRATERGYLNPSAMLSVGIRGPLNRADDLDFAAQHGVKVVTCGEARARGAGAIGEFVGRTRGMPTYLTFDIDVIDPAFAPGTGTPCPGGLSTAEAFDLLRACKGASLVGADVVEVLPDRDLAGVTSLTAAHVLLEILALDAAVR